jgi:hypothetical protein
MKKYFKEFIVFVLQLFMFYIFPLFAGPTDAMGMVLLILISTFVLGLIIGTISDTKMKFLYPVVVSILFIPSVWIYYNSSALIHSVWYFVVSLVGILIGAFIKWIIKKI